MEKHKLYLLTHAGTFHADDLLSTAFLLEYFKNYDCVIKRVGSIPDWMINNDSYIIYDINHGEFDHHQRNARVRENGIKYCAFGLIWDAYGLGYLHNLVDSSELQEKTYRLFVQKFVQLIDAYDNGQEIRGMAFHGASTVLRKFNPLWDDDNSSEAYEKKFYEALIVAKQIFSNEIMYALSNAKCEVNVFNALQTARNNEKKYIILDNYMPWKNFIVENPDAKEILYILYPSSRGDGYNIQAVPITNDGFENKKLLPKEWWGLKGEALVRSSGINELLFCHSNGYLGGAASLLAAIKIAEAAIKY